MTVAVTNSPQQCNNRNNTTSTIAVILLPTTLHVDNIGMVHDNSNIRTGPNNLKDNSEFHYFHIKVLSTLFLYQIL